MMMIIFASLANFQRFEICLHIGGGCKWFDCDIISACQSKLIMPAWNLSSVN
jgi:hypothetical protein